MRIPPLSALLGAAAILAFAACSNGTNRPPVNEPWSITTTSGAAVGVGTPAMNGDCPQPAPMPDVTDRTMCLKSCQGMDETDPAGSMCISRRESCTAKCASKYDHP